MQNKILKLFLIISFIFMVSSELNAPTQVLADVKNDRVMLVYDSENTTDKDNVKIDALQRALTSMDLRVRTVNQSDYKHGMLTVKYVGVISMLNWKQVGFTNKSFILDRNRFKGIKLHIGNNISSEETAAMGAKSVKLYQQQLVLKNNNSSQMLPFSETITVLDNLPSGAQTIGTLSTQQND